MGGIFPYSLHVFVVLSGRFILSYISSVYDRLICQKVERLHESRFLIAEIFYLSCAPAFGKEVIDALQKIQLPSCRLVGLGLFLGFCYPALHDFHVSDYELGVNDIDVVYRIDPSVYMHHVVIYKASDYMDYGFYFPDVSEEFVAQALALRRAFYKACDIAEFYCSVNGLP